MSIETVNTIARHWDLFMWSRIVDSTWVLIVVGVLWSLLRRRVSAQFGYCLFFLVLVKLVVPVQTPLPGNIGRALKTEWTPATVSAGEPSRLNSMPAAKPDKTVRAPALATQRDRRPDPIRRFPISTTAVLMAVWLTGVVYLLSRFAYTEWVTLRMIERSDRVDLNAAGISLDRLKAILHIKRPIRVVAGPAVTCPVVYGLWSPTLMVPVDFADHHSAEQMRWILLHELAHIQRWDMLVKLFQKIVQFAFFFHPGVWIANALIDRQREFACDDTAVLGSNLSRADCGESFLHIVKRISQTRTLVPNALGISSPNTAVRKRLMRMLDVRRTPQSRLSLWSCLLLAVIALLVVPFSAVASAPSAESPEVMSTAKPDDTTFPTDNYTQKDGQYIWKQSLSANVEDIKTLLCLSHGGDVTIKAHEDARKNTVEVRATIVLKPSEKLADDPDALKQILALKEKIGVILRRDDKKTPTRDDDTLNVQTVTPKKMSESIDKHISMDILMPAGLALIAKSDDGDLKASGLAGPISIKTADGDVSVSECLNSLSITSADGDVNIVDCTGPLAFKVADGDVKVHKCTKAIAIKTADGDVLLEQVQGPIDVKAADGDILVSFAGDPTQACSLESVDGDIAIAMPTTSKVTLDLQANEGDVHLDAPGFEGLRSERAAVGKLNGGGAAMKARSRDGDIAIQLK
jgi:beta-lactamase regulating signal transducer with metallopeptidase domain